MVSYSPEEAMLIESGAQVPKSLLAVSFFVQNKILLQYFIFCVLGSADSQIDSKVPVKPF